MMNEGETKAESTSCQARKLRKTKIAEGRKMRRKEFGEGKMNF